MTNSLFSPGREGFLAAEIDWDDGVIKASLLRGYVFDPADRFVTEVTGAGGVLVSTVTLTGKAITNGVADANDLLFGSVPAGPVVTSLLLYQASGPAGGADLPAGQQRLVGWVDTATGLPVTPNGNDVSVVWDQGPNRIFKL